MAADINQAHLKNGQPVAGTPMPLVMIRQAIIAAEDPSERFMKRQMPAWVISGGIHMGLMALFLVYSYWFSERIVAQSPENQILETKVDEALQKQNFENTDIGLNPDQQTNYNLDRIENVSVPGIVRPDEPVGIAGAPEGPPQTIPPPPGFGGGQGGGMDSAVPGAGNTIGDPGGFLGGRTLPGMAFGGRSGATRQKMVAEGGGNPASEAAVAKGLQWLVRQQKNDGRWTLVEGAINDDSAATALALLPFLAAGKTHRPNTQKPMPAHLPQRGVSSTHAVVAGLVALPGPSNPWGGLVSGVLLATAGSQRTDSRQSEAHDVQPAKSETERAYTKAVESGLSYLKSKQKANGSFGTRDLYGHAIATMALCEAYGMTQDPSLRKVAQSALDYLAKAQHPVGGYRYTPGQAGDTSVTGWCLQALKSGMMAGLNVDRTVLYKVGNFLDTVQTQNGAAYGYTGPGATAAMTAVGLLCRQYLGWGPKNPILVAGVDNLKKNMPQRGRNEIYYYYYATQVMHFFGGDDWEKVWNPKMRDLLVETQDNSPSKDKNGSWPPENSITGRSGGRMTVTCLSLLTLEVYYRHLPLYKRDNSGLKDLD